METITNLKESNLINKNNRENIDKNEHLKTAKSENSLDQSTLVLRKSDKDNKNASIKSNTIDKIDSFIYVAKISSNLYDRKNTFKKEYINSLNIFLQTTGEFKEGKNYVFCHIKVKDNTLTVLPYENIDMNKEIIESKKKMKNNFFVIPKKTEIKKEFPLFTINFNLVTCQLVTHKTKQKFRIIVLGEKISEDNILDSKVFKFKLISHSPEEYKESCRLINKSILSSKGFRKNKLNVSLLDKYYKDYFISYAEFRSGKTGDIVLFRSRKASALSQRAITMGDYDHVGIYVNKDGFPLVYEATSTDNIKTHPFMLLFEDKDESRKLDYDKVVLRRLISTKDAKKKIIRKFEGEKKIEKKTELDNITDKALEKKFYECINIKISEHIKRNKDSKYSLSGCNVCCSSEMKNYDKENQFFCSQLAAHVYYYLGFISNKVDAGHFLPGTFSRYNEIQFEEGFQLSEEFIVAFDEKK